MLIERTLRSMRIVDTSTPVVILRALNHGALGIARSLGSAGVPVYVVDANGRAPARFSRYCRKRFAWNFESATADESVAFLNGIARNLGRRPVLLPTTDASSLFVASRASDLSHAFIFPAQQFETARCLTDKYAMFELANQLDIPTPAAFRPESRMDVVRFAGTARFPIVMKRLEHGVPPGKQLRMTYICRDSLALLAEYDRLSDAVPPRVMLQEYIPGGEDTIWMFNGYFNERSECLFGATGHKIRQSPAYTGAACLAVCRSNGEVRRTTVRFMKAIGYRGILDIGYRFDARDGRYKVLDVNPRIGCTFRLFASDSGMDVARAMYLDLTRQHVPRAHVTDSRKWLVEDCDVASSIRYFRDGVLSFPEWIRSFRGVQELALFSFRDPLPAFTTCFYDGCEVMNRVMRWTGRRLLPHATPGAQAVPAETKRAANNGD